MLETIRELALERLAESGEEEALRRAHTEWFLGFALRSGLAEDSTVLLQRHELVIPEGANIRAAIDCAEEARDADTALTLAVELESYWHTNSPFEGARILTRLLKNEGVSSLVLARGLRCLGGCEQIVGDYDARCRCICPLARRLRATWRRAGRSEPPPPAGVARLRARRSRPGPHAHRSGGRDPQARSRAAARGAAAPGHSLTPSARRQQRAALELYLESAAGPGRSASSGGRR